MFVQQLVRGATMKAGITEQSNFDTYRLVRMADALRALHVELLDTAAPPGGIGEPGVPPVAPAIANAIFVLAGQRIRTLPLMLAGVRLTTAAARRGNRRRSFHRADGKLPRRFDEETQRRGASRTAGEVEEVTGDDRRVALEHDF